MALRGCHGFSQGMLRAFDTPSSYRAPPRSTIFIVALYLRHITFTGHQLLENKLIPLPEANAQSLTLSHNLYIYETSFPTDVMVRRHRGRTATCRLL